SVRDFHRCLMRIRSEEGGGFLCLVAALLSVQCLDSVALKAFESLREGLGGQLTVDRVSSMTAAELEPYIKSCNYYKTKAKSIHACAVSLKKRHGGRVPASFSSLVQLEGVGPKIANLVLSVGLGDESAGLVVDTHVHRVAGRLGWAVKSADGGKAEDSRRMLEEWVPESERVDFTLVLISFGQTVCTPLRPSCDVCPVRACCPSA
ncbi:hypothetical protein GUITHDRAFT_43372, partial [Guillardia theta CCMP2712]